MSFKNTFAVVAGLATASFLSSCGGDDAPKKANNGKAAASVVYKQSPVERVDSLSKINQNKKTSILERIKTNVEAGDVPSLYSSPVETEAQLIALTVDSADQRLQVYLDVPAGYAYMMDRMSAKNGKDAYALKDIGMKYFNMTGNNYPYAAAVHLAHPSAAKKNNTHKNDTQTNLNELKIYGDYGSLMTRETANIYDENETIPALGKVITPENIFRLSLSNVLNVATDKKNKDNLKFLAIKREPDESENYTDRYVYNIYMGMR